MIKVKNAEVQLTEQTVKELMWAIENAKKEVEFITEPIPNGNDMPKDYVIQEQKKRGIIRVRSEYSGIEYIIRLEVELHTQESLGYKLV